MTMTSPSEEVDDLSEFPFHSTEGDLVAISKRNDPNLGNVLSTADGREWVESENTLVFAPLDKKYVEQTAEAIPPADPAADEAGGEETPA